MATISWASSQGLRSEQEDRILIHHGDDYSLLAVFDGHNGARAADICKDNLVSLFPTDPRAPTRQALKTLCKRLHRATRECVSGTTLTLAHIAHSGHTVTIASVGDSPAILVDSYGRLRKSRDHNVRTNEAERARAIKRGGVYLWGYLHKNVREFGVQCARVFGDADLTGVVSRRPSILTAHFPRAFLLATDGLFDPAHEDESLLPEILTRLNEGADAKRILAFREARETPEDNASLIVWHAV